MENPPVQSIDRLFNIVELLADFPSGVSLTDIAAKLDLNKSTVHRLLSSLVDRGYAIKDAESGKYRLTMRLFEIGNRVVSGLNIVSIARPYLENLSVQVGETVHLVIRDRNDIVYLYKEESMQNSIRTSSLVGLRSPMYCTSVGKSILSTLTDEEVESVWKNSDIRKITPNTITSLQQLKQELSLIREQGYAVDNEENEKGIRCVGAVICDYSEKAIGAVSTSAPAFRLDSQRIEEIASSVKDTAKKISELLGADETKVYIQ